MPKVGHWFLHSWLGFSKFALIAKSLFTIRVRDIAELHDKGDQELMSEPDLESDEARRPHQ